VVGCLIVGLLVLILFIVVPWPLWPVLIVGLVIVFAIAAALGLLRGVFSALGGIFGRRP
jgi:hypothetical protein